jgi:hypothetical protein
MIPVTLNVLPFVRVRACVCVCGVYLLSVNCNYVWHMCQRNVPKWQSYPHCQKHNQWSFFVVPLTSECNHDMLLALSVYAKIRSAVESWQESRRQFWSFPVCLKFSNNMHNIHLLTVQFSHNQSIFQHISAVTNTSSGNSACKLKDRC